MTTELYRHFDSNGALLYVGISLSTVHRLSQHSTTSPWFDQINRIEVERFQTREEAITAEKAAILVEKPKYNVQNAKRQSEELKKAVQEITRHDQSRQELVERLVNFKPIYSMDDAAEVLGVSTGRVKELIDSGKLGCVELNPPHTVVWKGKTVTRTTRRKITGWQLIDFIESLEERNVKNRRH